MNSNTDLCARGSALTRATGFARLTLHSQRKTDEKRRKKLNHWLNPRMNYEKCLLFHCHCFLMFLYPFLYDVDKCNARIPEVLDEQYAVL